MRAAARRRPPLLGAAGPAVTAAAARVVSAWSGLLVLGLFYLMVVSVLAGLWSSAAAANGGSIAGYSAAALVWYIVATEAAVVSVPPKLIEYTGDDIGSGRVVVELLRPASIVTVRVATELGAMLPRLALCAGFGVTFASLLVGWPPQPGALLLAGPSLLLAAAVNVVTQHAFAAASFWVRDAKGAWFLYQKLVFVVGGMLLPLEVLPDWLERGARVLPFQAMAYAAGRHAAGHLDPALIVIQVGWLVVMWAVAVGVFAAGERRLTKVGA
jgi:ABC-2 type transport system permease protein